MKHFFLLESKLSNKNLFFVPTGMGFRGAISHWQDIIGYVNPDLIVSFGFCGELFSSGTGDLFLSCRFIPLPSNQFFRPVEHPLRSEILNFCASHGINIATSISTPVFIPKRNVMKLIQNLFTEHEIARLAMSNVIVDMESAIIANLAARDKIPVLSFRVSTDTCAEEIPFDVEELLDEKGFVSARKSFYILCKSPLLAKSFLRFWKTSRQAAEKLTSVVIESITDLGLV